MLNRVRHADAQRPVEPFFQYELPVENFIEAYNPPKRARDAQFPEILNTPQQALTDAGFVQYKVVCERGVLCCDSPNLSVLENEANRRRPPGVVLKEESTSVVGLQKCGRAAISVKGSVTSEPILLRQSNQ